MARWPQLISWQGWTPMIDSVEVRRGTYHDSVRLMQASRTLRHDPEVEEAMVAMATPLNLELLDVMGFDLSAVGDAGPNDLVVAVRAVSDEAAARCRSRVAAELGGETRAHPEMTATPPAHVVGSAAEGATLALISVPGEHAFVEAMDALHHGLHPMVFSNDVPLAQEVALKATADRLGLLVMGPDCGTAIVNGVGLGFANVVEPGPVGIVGAAGTGIQQLCCLLDWAGVGVRHALGTGGSDLSSEVGGSSTLRALAALDDDPGTEVVVVVSKSPTPEAAATVEEAAARCSTPTVLALLDEGVTLEGAAGATLDLLGVDAPAYPSWPNPSESHRPGYLRGHFSGGSLRNEAAAIASVLGPIGHGEHDGGHTFVDFGDAAYTRGRAHPMIDFTLRLQHLRQAALDPDVGVILVDVVLGHGAHPDPATELAPTIDIARAEGTAVVVSLCGTRGDPQDRDRQARTLNDAGASVWLSNAAAARHAVSLIEGGPHA
jgi:succinyl-CoA synthetase alpha subunit